MDNNKACRKCRREGIKLFLKGSRCDLPKCSFVKRNYAPGIHGQSRKRKPSDFFVQLREKQKARAIYGLRETQFKNTFIKAAQSKTNTGEKLLQKLETRLDNVVYRLGFAPSRKASRQMINHGRILVNSKKVSIPSFSCKKNDLISFKIKPNEISKSSELPVWLEMDGKKIEGKISKIPSRNEINTDISEQLIIEFYNR